MADNTTLNAGSGGDIIATDDVGGIKYQRVKLALGSDGISNGDVSSKNPMPVDDVTKSSDLFQQDVVSGRYNQIEIEFDETDPDLITDITVTKNNGGDAINSAGQAVFSTSTNTNAGVKVVSNTSVLYRPHFEIYAAFSCIFSAGLASSYQRIGLYDTNNGFYIGYEGTSFGVTIRKATVNTTTAQASFNVDTLTGGANSKFTRNGVPESLDTTKDNLYRIRFGWLGAAPINFEVFSPDGEWVVFHTIKHPNTVAATSINNPDLPITLDLQKTAAGATNLTMSTACWAAGTTSDLGRVNATITDKSLVKFVRSVLTAKQPSGNYTNIDATAGGNLKVSIEEADPTAVINIADNGGSITVDGTVSATQSGTWSVRNQDGSGNNVTSRATGSARPFDVAIVDGSGNQVTSFGGGTQYADGTASATPTGTVAMGTDGTNVYAIATDNAGNVGVNVQNSVTITDGGGSITIDGTVTASQQASTAYKVIISDGASDVPIDAAHSDGETNTENHIDVGAKGLYFNGSTWDRMRGSVTDGLLVNLGANNDVTITGTVAVTDNGGSLTVDGTVAATQSGTWILGANSGVDIGDVTINNASGASAVNIQDGGNSITVDGTVTVTDGLNIEGDVAHDTVDSGNPVKIGFQAESSLTGAVATGDRVNGVADVFGRQLVSHIDAGMQVWKSPISYTTQQAGTDVWIPSAGKRIAITYIAVSSFATTAGKVTLWFGASGDTTYTAGTDQAVWVGSFAPSANAKPGAIISLPNAIYAVTADHRLKITTDAAISLDLTVYGYEY